MDLIRLVKKLDLLFKIPLAEPWDNVGLLIQPSNSTSISRISLTIDLTEPVLDEVISSGANFIISYHPPIFHPLKRITQRTWKERIVIRCLEHKIAVYSPHTALDAVSGGVNDWLLSPFDLICKTPIVGNKLVDRPATVAMLPGRKLQEYCIRNNITPVECGMSSSNGELSEIIVSGDEPEFLGPQLNDQLTFSSEEGPGRIGLLKEDCTIKDIVEAYKKLFNVPILKVALGNGKTLDSLISSVAVCAGSGGALFAKASMSNVADILVTGEASHHEQLDLVARGATIITAGHSVTERGYLAQCLRPWLQREIRPSIPIDVASADAEPGVYTL